MYLFILSIYKLFILWYNHICKKEVQYMERKDVTPENEALLKLYNDNNKRKIKMEHVYEDDGTFLRYFGYDMDISSAK